MGGVCAEGAAESWREHHARRQDTQRPRERVRDLCTGLCETGFGGPGGRFPHVWLLSRASSHPGASRPGAESRPASPRWTEAQGGGPAPDRQSPGDRREPTTPARPETLAAGGGQFCPPGLRQGHPAGCVEASGLPIQCSAWHHPDCGPSRRPSRAPCPRLPYPAADGSFSLNLFSCET